MTRKSYKQLLHAAALALTFTGLVSCNFMHDDLPECAVRPDVKTTVKFVYDYNTADADRFGQDVGAVTLYVFGDDGKYVGEYERTNMGSGNSLKSEDFSIDLDLQPGKYKVYALAHANPGGYQATLKLPGAKYRLAFDKSEPVENLRVKLDNVAGTVRHDKVMLDTMWTTLDFRELDVPMVEDPKEGDPQQPDVLVTATIPLMRMTNHLKFSFHQTEMPTSIDASQYEIWIETARGRDQFNVLGNFASTSNDRLRYEPYKVWTDKDQQGNTSVFTEFSFTRVMFDTTNPDRAMLYIHNKITGEVKKVDLLPLLAVGNQAFAQKGWTDQQYFDREYDFECHQAFDGNIPKYAVVYVNMLSWSKRIQNSELW